VEIPTVPEEEWRPVVGYEARYAVSSLGRVWSLAWRRVMTQRLDQYGYFFVKLWNDTEQRRCYVHLLVAFAFIGPRPGKKQVNHKNGVKTDNSEANLEYTTALENMRHSWRMGLHPRGEKDGNSKLLARQVREIRRRYVRLSQQDGIRGIARDYGVHPSTIKDIIHRRTWKRYVERVPDPSPSLDLERQGT
jgi:hypothetical protein